ncbi:hypothetical protein DMN91_012315 [Ooceraea biroi]|uniref:Mos1 transposase HTH domain-containing protein n=1 Tax=Ooceraea biroi TaxID=2015173 RepID=A0A3L8D5A2_OOCBI|nr:hypothetical protein DMN91_012315 [Ooceraea biroi]
MPLAMPQCVPTTLDEESRQFARKVHDNVTVKMKISVGAFRGSNVALKPFTVCSRHGIAGVLLCLVSETARNINAVFGEGSTTKATVGNWFKNFRDGDFSLANEPRGRPKTKVDNDHLRAVVESDPSQSTRELASRFNVSIPTILVHLAAIVSETARNINAVFGEGSTTKATVGNWFKNFRDGDFSLANEPRGRPKTKVDNDHLRAVVESDPSQSTRELASIFNVSIPTILVHLAAIESALFLPYDTSKNLYKLSVNGRRVLSYPGDVVDHQRSDENPVYEEQANIVYSNIA